MTYADRITIGIPAFNESRYIGEALASALGQSHRIIVSDNGSDDETAKICAEAAATNPGIQLIRHLENKGAVFNFRFVLDQCQTEYFMWLGGHDQIPPDYTRILVAHLDDDPEAVMAYGNARHIDREGNPLRTETYKLLEQRLKSGRRAERMQAIVRHLYDCSLIHGVWRAEDLRRAWVGGMYLGVDHVILLQASAIGPLRHSASTYLLRRNPRSSDSFKQQLQRMTGRTSRISPTRTDMYLAQLRIIYSTLGVFAGLTASMSILSRLGIRNVVGFILSSIRRLIAHA